jgi:PEP-CTERM motif
MPPSKWLLASAFTAALGATVVPSARAAAVFVLGGNYTVTGSNFPSNFGPETVTLDQTTKPIDSGALTVSETITPVNATTAFILFNFATPGGGSLAGDANANWVFAIGNIPIHGSGVLSTPFVYFTANGVPYGPLTAASGFGVITNPITGTGQVLDFVGFTPGVVTGSFTLDVFSNPYTFLNSVGVDTGTADDVHFGAEISLIPEPASMLLAGLGLLGLSAVRRRGTARS